MVNTFKNTDLVVRDASIILANNLVFGNLSNRDHEQEFDKKVGQTIEIKRVPVQTARDFIVDGSTTDNAITEPDVDLTLTKEPYIAHTLTTLQKTLDLDDYSVVVTGPAVRAINKEIDVFLAAEAVRGFARNNAGTEGTTPSTLAHLAAGNKLLSDLGCPDEGRVGVINTTAQASFILLPQFTSADYGSERPNGLRNATMGRLYSFDWFTDQNVATHDIGDIAAQGTNVMGALQSGSTLIIDNGGTTSTGTITEGTRFTIAGLALTYTVINADVDASGGSFTLAIAPALESVPADDAAITPKAAATGNVIYKKDAFGVAIVAPAALAIGSSVATYNGTGMRVTLSTSTVNLSDQMVYDTLCGAVVIEPDGGGVLCG